MTSRCIPLHMTMNVLKQYKNKAVIVLLSMDVSNEESLTQVKALPVIINIKIAFVYLFIYMYFIEIIPIKLQYNIFNTICLDILQFELQHSTKVTDF